MNIEKKLSYNKILVKAEASIDVLYNLNNEIQIKNIKIPVMNFIEMKSVSDENIIDLNYVTRFFQIENKVKSSGNLGVEIELEIECNMYEKYEISIIEDMYCLDKKVVYTQKQVEVESMEMQEKQEYSFEEKIGLENINQIYMYKSDIVFSEELQGKSLEGNLSLDIYCSKEEQSNLIIKKVNVPFLINDKYNKEELEIKSLEIKSINSEYYCSFIIGKKEQGLFEKYNVLTDFKYEEIENKNNYSMVIYFVKPNDTLWKIAKLFNVKIESLEKVNDKEKIEKLQVGEKLYIMRG